MPASNPTSAGSPTEWTLASLLAVDLVWTVLCLGGYRSETMVVTWGVTSLAVIVYLGVVAWTGERPHPASGWMLPFLLYAAANVVWVSPVGWLGWRDWFEWLHIFVVFWVVLNGVRSIGPRKLLFSVSLGLAVVAVLLAAYQRFVWPEWLMMGRHQVPQFLGRASGPFGIPNSLAAFLLLLIPATLALAWQRGASLVQRIFFGYLALVFLFGLGLTISRGAWLSLALALVAWPLLVGRRKWEERILTSIGALTVALLIGGAAYFLVPRIETRLDNLVRDSGEKSRPILWQGAWSLFQEASLLGVGGGSYDVLFERHRPEQFNDEPQWAHNEYLNTLSDYGLVGFVLLFGGVAVTAFQARQRVRTTFPEATIGWAAPDVSAAISAGLVAFGFSAFVDFNLKIPALGMMVAITGAEVIRRNWWESAHKTRGVYQLGSLAVGAGFLIMTLASIIPAFRGEAARSEGREVIDMLARSANPTIAVQKEALTQADLASRDAVEIDEHNGQSWADRAYVLSLWARIAPQRMNELGGQAEVAARESLKKAKVVPEFWVRLGVSMDMQGRWVEGGDAFLEALKLAPHNAVVWYYYGYHLSLQTATRQLALAAIDTSLRLDGGNRSAILLRESLRSSH